MDKQPTTVEFSLPDWISRYCEKYQASKDINERMRFVIGAAKENVSRNSGGPFAAAIFEAKTGKLIALGVNLVTTQGMSMLHAEMVAIAIAQKRLGTYDLGANSDVSHELISSTEPCSMCFGAIPWSGVRRVITGALDEDARHIGFDEGPKPEDWKAELTRRGIQVVDQVERELAADVLLQYMHSNGHIYNSREG